MPKAFTVSFARIAASLFQLLIRSMSVPTIPTATTVPVIGLQWQLAQFLSNTVLPAAAFAWSTGKGNFGA